MKKKFIISRQLGISSGICLCLIFLLSTLTEKRLKTNQKNHLIHSLNRVLPVNQTLMQFDNDVIADKQLLGTSTIYPACKNQQLQLLIVKADTDKGYSGNISLLATLDINKRQLIATRPLFHQETPGLGDQIDSDKSPWLKQFLLPLSTPKKHLALKKEGGQIDAIAGATITSRAVSQLMRTTIFSIDIALLKRLCRQKK